MKELHQITSKYIILALALVISPLLTSCEDPVEVDTPTGDPVLNIDAWLDNKLGARTIRLSFIQPYFDNDNLPPAASGATVTVTDGTVFIYNFTEKQPGTYEWAPENNERLGVTGRVYTLTVNYKGETYVRLQGWPGHGRNILLAATSQCFVQHCKPKSKRFTSRRFL